MEEIVLNSDFISIQSILIELNKSLGGLTKIRHRGGNEDKISRVVQEISTYLSSKNYIEKDLVNKQCKKELEDIVLFLMLNTELCHPIDIEKYSNLIDVTPKLSKCLLANVVVELNLGEAYSLALPSFSLDEMEEFIAEMIPCLKKSDPRLHLEYAYFFIQQIIKKILNTESSEQVEEPVDKVTDVCSQLLLNLTGFHAEHSNIQKLEFVYQHMGYTLWRILDLLLLCDTNNLLLLRVIEKLISTCSTLVMAITLTVFCSWAEIEEDGQVLQSLIGAAAYSFIEKYQKFKPAKELISMMSTIAKKPKTVNELIHQADIPTMIAMINKADSNQKEWFRALLYTQALKSKNAVGCIDKWSHLCDADDVSRLLNLSTLCRDADAKKVVIKCASALSLDELKIVSVRHLHQNGIGANLNDDIYQQTVLLFNKFKNTTPVQDDLSKELHLLLLQNPADTLSYVFGECLKNSFFTLTLKEILPSFKEVANVENVGLNTLIKIMRENKPDEQNWTNYAEFLNALIEVGFYSVEVVVLEIVLPGLEESIREENCETLLPQLEILEDIQELVCVKSETEILFTTLFAVMKSNRSIFLEFSRVKHEIVHKTVTIIDSYCDVYRHSSSSVPAFKTEGDPYVTFYKNKLWKTNPGCTLLKHLDPDFATSSHGRLVTLLIKLLPVCVKPEWLSICVDCCNTFGVQETAEAFTDALIMLCQLIKKQDDISNEASCMTKGLKCCLQNFGIVIKECLQLRMQSPEEDVNITKNVCRLLKEIPNDQFKREEGLSLANLLSDRSLRSLRNDKQFACLIVSIGETYLCQVLAQKVLK